jgi:hypothetical protein
VIALYVAGLSGDYQVLESAVDLKPGTITLPEFQVNMEGQYEIVLAVERNLPRDDLDDLLGGQPTLNSPGSVVDLKWTLTSGNSIVASGSSRNEKGGGVGGGYAYRDLGRFDGLPQTPYVLEVNTLLDGSALAPAKPRIIVRLHWEDYLGKILIPRVGGTIYTLIAVIGILCLWDIMDLLCQGNPDQEIQGDAPQAEN